METRSPESTGHGLKLAIAAILLALILTFVIQNTEVVAVRFLLWEFKMSRVILILLAVAAGFGAGWLVARFTGRKRAASA